MPISRYEIRNEYSLADPELYRAADKDDPEALLEGVAMAGLVGVLRQLGDLAEFAAEIFHNLHEEVMATAARGHGLMTRVQQLETEVPSIERAFLSQTDHSSFFHHPGLDWHPNLRIDQNLVTQGNLPRFIMDSYEECRGPPRLFLLDKFDIAGAGACLKRYTDPSFFKIETSGMTTADIPREKKIRKAKKKGPRRKKEESTGVLPTSHTKLHQLFLQEEHTENGVNSPTRHAKLKRRLNGFPFNLKTGKSYMEKLLHNSSPDNKVVREVTVNSLPVMSTTSSHKESGVEVVEVEPLSPDRENERRKRSPPSSPDREEIMMKSSLYDPSEAAVVDKVCELPSLYPSIATDGGISATSDKVTREKDIAMDAESNREIRLTGYQSDDIASEVDNYVDAPSTIESDTDVDSRPREKSDFTSSHIRNESLVSDANEENLQIRSFDSQSTGDSSISDEGNNLSRKEISSSTSDSPSTSAGNPQSERISARGFSSADIPEVDKIVDDASSYLKTDDEDLTVDQHSKPVVNDDTYPITVEITNHDSCCEQVPSSLCSLESIATSVHPDSGIIEKDKLAGRKADKMECILDTEEKKSNLVIEPPSSPYVSDSDLQSGDESRRSSSGEPLVDESNVERIPCISTVSYVHCHTADSSDKVTSDLLHMNECDQEDLKLVENIAFGLIPGKLDGEKLHNKFPSVYPDIVQSEDSVKSMVSVEENLIKGLDNEDSGVLTDSPNQFPSFIETFLTKKLEETSSANGQTHNAEDDHSNSSTDNRISSENLVLSHLVNSYDWPPSGLDAHEGNVIPDEDTTVNVTYVLGTPKSCVVLGSLGTGLPHHGTPNDSEAQVSSSFTPGELKEPAETSGSVELDGTKYDVQEVTEISGPAELKLPNEVHILLDEPDSEEGKSNNADIISVVRLSDNFTTDDVPSPVGLNKLVEEHIHSYEDSGIGELENDKNGLSGSHWEVGHQTKAAASGSEAVLCNTVDNDNPKSQLSGTIANTHLGLEVNQDLNLIHPEIIQPPLEQSLLDIEHEISQQSVLVNHVLDDYEPEKPIAQGDIGLLPSRLDQDLLHSSKISSEVSPMLPVTKGDNASELPRLSANEINVPKDPLDSVLPPSNPISETNQINLADLPPLPPLPPVQWMMGKLQNASSSTAGEMVTHKELFPKFISQPMVSTDNASSGSCPPTASTNDDGSSIEEMKNSLIKIVNEPASNYEKFENSYVEADTGHETIDLPPKSENKQREFAVPTSESELASPSEEDGNANESRMGKLPRPRHPLIDEFAALDKSKLRKVTERVMPQIQKVDERDSLLEQIRTKSFNLRPSLASRPSIRGPNTNLKVAAIVEKANAIRQALAGSDEDDDSWSDS
ncbi:hypothetical protein OROHE_013410 [Orobanche hederae]